MAYRDFREYLARLEQTGQLARVRAEVDLQYEIGAICRRVLDADGPALLFERPGGYSVPLVTNILGTRERYAMALETTVDCLDREWVRRTAHPISPLVVNTGPCKENILLGDDVDLFKLPIPVWNELDGGAYITFPCYISKDPETGERNCGMYRTMVHDRNTVGLLAAPFRHLALQRAKAPDKPFPVAIALGLDPVIHIATVAPFPQGVDEMAMAGALREAPVELVPCETIPLDVPATAEVVLEGEITPGVLLDEGPFGEVSGYYGLRVPRPLIKIKAMTFRNNLIHEALYEGRPPNGDSHVMQAVPMEAELLRLVPLPGLRRVFFPDGGAGALSAVVSIDKRFEGHGKMMAMAILGTWAGRTIKILTIVDDDIDPSDHRQVEWAIATRVQPDRDVDIIKEAHGMVLDPSMRLEDRNSGSARTSKMIIDATRYDAREFEIVCSPDKKAAERVERDWARYGIPVSLKPGTQCLPAP